MLASKDACSEQKDAVCVENDVTLTCHYGGQQKNQTNKLKLPLLELVCRHTRFRLIQKQKQLMTGKYTGLIMSTNVPTGP